MNIKKTIKFILIAVPLLFLAKLGIESAIYNSNKTPEINPNPKEKLRIYGKFPLDTKKYYIFADVSYYTTNPKCDNVNWLEGARNAQRKYIKDLNTTISDSYYEFNIYNDYFNHGICDWKVERIYINIVDRATNRSSYNVKLFANENVGFAFLYQLAEVNSILNFVCNYEHNTSSDYTHYFCKDVEQNISIGDRNALFLPDSQKELEVNFKQMAEPIKNIQEEK